MSPRARVVSYRRLSGGSRPTDSSRVLKCALLAALRARAACRDRGCDWAVGVVISIPYWLSAMSVKPSPPRKSASVRFQHSSRAWIRRNSLQVLRKSTKSMQFMFKHVFCNVYIGIKLKLFPRSDKVVHATRRFPETPRTFSLDVHNSIEPSCKATTERYD